MMYRGLNVTWIVVIFEVLYSLALVALGYLAGRYL